jgi:steroid delta-isomerase-like uncharacterized protein
MSADMNKALVRRVYDEVINQAQASLIDELFAPDVVTHDPLQGTAHGIEAFRQLLGMFDAGFPQHRVSIEQLIAEDNMVCVLHTHTATHRGPFMGLPATGKDVVVGGIELLRVRDGKIVELWRKDDDVSLLMQLGLLAAPQPAAA